MKASRIVGGLTRKVGLCATQGWPVRPLRVLLICSLWGSPSQRCIPNRRPETGISFPRKDPCWYSSVGFCTRLREPLNAIAGTQVASHERAVQADERRSTNGLSSSFPFEASRLRPLRYTLPCDGNYLTKYYYTISLPSQ